MDINTDYNVHNNINIATVYKISEYHDFFLRPHSIAWLCKCLRCVIGSFEAARWVETDWPPDKAFPYLSLHVHPHIQKEEMKALECQRENKRFFSFISLYTQHSFKIKESAFNICVWFLTTSWQKHCSLFVKKNVHPDKIKHIPLHHSFVSIRYGFK